MSDSKIQKLQKRLAAGEQIVLDGGMGSEINNRGVATTLPLWSADALFSHPEVIQKIHEDNIKAGAEIIITATFRTTQRAFAKKNIVKQATKMTYLACTLAKRAIRTVKPKHDVYIAASVAPLEECYSPELTPPRKEMKKEHEAFVQDLKDGGADFILFETMITLREAVSGLKAAKKVGIPAAVCFCVNDKGQLLSGESLEEVISVIERLQPLFVGVNCVSLHVATQTVRTLKQLTTLPVCVYAQGDGGTDKEQGWKITQAKQQKEYIKSAKQWCKDGAQIIGGCCGTTPSYIKDLSNMTKSMQSM